MQKSATDVMQEVVVAAVLDSLDAFKAGARGVPNALLRELNAVHPNTTLKDLPAEVQAALQASVRQAFARLLKEGYAVAPTAGAPRPMPPRPSGPRSDAPRPRPRLGGGPAPVIERRKRPPKPPGKG